MNRATAGIPLCVMFVQGMSATQQKAGDGAAETLNTCGWPFSPTWESMASFMKSIDNQVCYLEQHAVLNQRNHF